MVAFGIVLIEHEIFDSEKEITKVAVIYRYVFSLLDKFFSLD